jgi:glycosyltransferase involved in cell wall biosynthesis/SAM-dependent methyltransferase
VAELREAGGSPLVSVIIPIFDAERFLPDAIESVFAQTYDAWELLLVDDGSTDGSTEIARGYADRCPERVRYLHHAGRVNRGLAASRNLGFRHAKGAYIAFLDADDLWLPHKLEQQVAILEAHPHAGMVYGRSQWWFSWTGDPGDRDRDYLHQLGVPADTPIEPPNLFGPYYRRQVAAIPTPSSILVRRDVLQMVEGFVEDPRNDLYEDQSFYAKVILAAPVIASNECWDRYRQHPGSVTTIGSREGQDVRARIAFLDWLIGYLGSRGLAGTDLWRSVRRERWWYGHPAFRSWRERTRRLERASTDLVARLARLVVPAPVRARVWARLHAQVYVPPVKAVRFGDLRRLAPFSRDFGYERGTPVDRYYIERFLATHQGDVRGNVLEVADDTYTKRFGGSRVSSSDILHVAPGDPRATIVADLSDAGHIPDASFDCAIVTQTLQVVYDVPAVVRTLYRILRPGGVALVTVPGISQISRYDMDRWGYYWSFTSLSLRKLFATSFPEANILTESFGNVLTATAFLYGLAWEELRRGELEHRDPDYEVIIGLRAVKPGDGEAEP